MYKWFGILLIFLFLLCPYASAEECTGIPNPEALFDGETMTGQLCEENASLTLEDPEGIGGLYLIFDRPYGSISLTDGAGEECVLDTGGILHYYIDVKRYFQTLPENLTLCFSDGEAHINEVYFFRPGETPDWVQTWQTIPDGETDLLLMSTHGDDEQLFFAGLLPYYAAERGKRVQVAYLTDHRNLDPTRIHEMLNGLWAVGVRDYPVFGPYDDYYTFDLQDAYQHYADAGHSEEEMIGFVVALLRRCKPQVVVGHDIRGEYGHGMHQLYTDLLIKALDAAPDPKQFLELPESWDVPKTYLHLYENNPITMDWDLPLASFDGKTAYEVTKELGFPSHASQQKDFAWYFRGSDRAADVPRYSPCRYGLYRSTVGKDWRKNDFFENLPPADPLEDEFPEIPTPQPTSVSVSTHPADKLWIYVPAAAAIALSIMISLLAA